MKSGPLIALVACVVLAQFHTGLAKATDTRVKRQSSGAADTSATLLEDVGDLVASVVQLVLRAATALVSTGSEATKQVAVGVGAASFPAFINVSKSLDRVQKNGGKFFNESFNNVGRDKTLSNIVTRLSSGVEPLLKNLTETVNQVSKGVPAATQPKKNPFDIEIDDVV